MPELEADPLRRDDTTVIARELLPIFEEDHAGWRALRRLHDPPRAAQMTFDDWITSWANTCTYPARCAVERLAAVMDVT